MAEKFQTLDMTSKQLLSKIHEANEERNSTFDYESCVFLWNATCHLLQKGQCPCTALPTCDKCRSAQEDHLLFVRIMEQISRESFETHQYPDLGTKDTVGNSLVLSHNGDRGGNVTISSKRRTILKN